MEHVKVLARGPAFSKPRCVSFGRGTARLSLACVQSVAMDTLRKTWQRKVPPAEESLVHAVKQEMHRFADDIFRPELHAAMKNLEDSLSRRLKLEIGGRPPGSRQGSKSPPVLHEGTFEESVLAKAMRRSQSSISKTSRSSKATDRARLKEFDQDDWVGRIRQGMHNRGCEYATQLRKNGRKSTEAVYREVVGTQPPVLGTAEPLVGSQQEQSVRNDRRSTAEEFRASARRIISMHDVEDSSQHGLFQFAPSESPWWPAVPADPTEVEVELSEDGPFKKFMRSRAVEYIAAVVIMTNMLFMGIQADYDLKHTGDEEPKLYTNISLGFCALFSLELLLRLLAERKDFLFGEDVLWNLLDLGLVSLQVVDEVLPLVWPAKAKTGVNFSFLRVLRVLRTARILRVVRMCKFVSELRVLIVTLSGSMRSLFWTVILLLYLTSCMGLYITQAIKERQKINPFEPEEEEAIKEHFGSMCDTMWSLYLAVSNGIEWRILSKVLAVHVSPMSKPVFGLYIAFTVFALLNIITGIFMNSAIASADADRHENLVEQMKRTFENTDTDNSGSISVAEFENHLTDPEMQVYLRGLGWRADQAMELFNMLDVDASGEINVGEFLAGCSRLQGGTKAVDFAAFMFEFNRLKARITEHMDALEKVMLTEPFPRDTSPNGDG